MKRSYVAVLMLAGALGIARVATVDAQDADALAAEGSKAFQSGDFKTAHQKYSEAFKVKPAPDIAGNLAQCELELGKKREAAEHLAFAIRLAPLSTKPATKQAMEKALAGLRQELFEIKFAVQPRGVEATIDGGPAFLVSNDNPIFLEPGRHTLTFSLAGHVPETRELEATKAGSRELNVELSRQAGATASASASASAAPSATASASAPPPSPGIAPLPPILFGSAAAIGLGLGIGFLVGSESAFSDAEATAAGCRDFAASCVSDGEEQIDQSNLFRGIAIGGFALAGAGLAGVIISLALPIENAPADSARIGVTPWLSPSAGGATISGSF